MLNELPFILSLGCQMSLQKYRLAKYMPEKKEGKEHKIEINWCVCSPKSSSLKNYRQCQDKHLICSVPAAFVANELQLHKNRKGDFVSPKSILCSVTYQSRKKNSASLLHSTSKISIFMFEFKFFSMPYIALVVYFPFFHSCFCWCITRHVHLLMLLDHIP